MKKAPKKGKFAHSGAHGQIPIAEIPSAWRSTAEIAVPERTIDQVIGQDNCVELIKKAAMQKRNVLLVGLPGTGKSMLAQAMAEILPVQKMQDILVYPNSLDSNNPKVKMVDAGKGKQIVNSERMNATAQEHNSRMLAILFPLGFFILSSFMWSLKWISDVIFAATIILGGILLIGFVVASQMRMRFSHDTPKLLIDNSEKKTAPFIEATGARAGSLLGDVLHDPLQCIPADELVHLPNGRPAKIKELIDPLFEKCDNQTQTPLLEPQTFMVLAGADNYFGFKESKVKNVFRRHYEGELIELKTKKGYSIRTTPNHPIAIFDENGFVKYISAENVKNDNSVVVPEKLPITTKEILPKPQLTLLADILADGHVAERSVHFKLRREFKIAQIEADVKAAGFKPKILKYGKNTTVSINSAEFVRYLKKIGLIENKQKRIPSTIFDQPTDGIITFLSKYLSLDGYVSKQGQFELISKELIPDFIPLLLKIGIRANYRPRIDRGFSFGKIQPQIFFQEYEFAKAYFNETANPYHKNNLKKYLSKTSTGHVAFDDVMPVAFDLLEKIRIRAGLSKTKIHDEYYSLNQSVSTSKMPTRNFLSKVVSVLMLHTNCEDLFKLRDLVQGKYAFDKIIETKRIPYNGFVYNMTTEDGTYLVNNVLTHNSGGLGTPAHLRVEPGAIHKANGGVLFLDEIATLSPKAQQELLTAMQEKKYPITGQSENSSGAMVRTEAVPCDFVLVAAGNYEDLQKVHPALRSRIRGYGYEIYMNWDMPDNEENRGKLMQFIAQEIKKDGRIPAFSKETAEAIIFEARRRASKKNTLTLKLRDLGGLIRAAGDIAIAKQRKSVMPEDLQEAKISAKTLEQQIAGKIIEDRKAYEVYFTQGSAIGRVNGLAVSGEGDAGLVLPIEAEIAPAASKSEGKLIATGKLGEIAKEAVQNVSALIKKLSGKDVSKYDLHIQFLQTYEGVEGDSASISVATAVISALEGIPIKQNLAMTGSLSVRGEVLPVAGITAKVQAAMKAGFSEVIIPKANLEDVVLGKKELQNIKIIPVRTLSDVLANAFEKSGAKVRLLNNLKKLIDAHIPLAEIKGISPAKI